MFACVQSIFSNSYAGALRVPPAWWLVRDTRRALGLGEKAHPAPEPRRERAPQADRCPDDAIDLRLGELLGPLRDTPARDVERPREVREMPAEDGGRFVFGHSAGEVSAVDFSLSTHLNFEEFSMLITLRIHQRAL